MHLFMLMLLVCMPSVLLALNCTWSSSTDQVVFVPRETHRRTSVIVISDCDLVAVNVQFRVEAGIRLRLRRWRMSGGSIAVRGATSDQLVDVEIGIFDSVILATGDVLSVRNQSRVSNVSFASINSTIRTMSSSAAVLSVVASGDAIVSAVYLWAESSSLAATCRSPGGLASVLSVAVQPLGSRLAVISDVNLWARDSIVTATTLLSTGVACSVAVGVLALSGGDVVVTRMRVQAERSTVRAVASAATAIATAAGATLLMPLSPTNGTAVLTSVQLFFPSEISVSAMADGQSRSLSAAGAVVASGSTFISCSLEAFAGVNSSFDAEASSSSAASVTSLAASLGVASDSVGADVALSVTTFKAAFRSSAEARTSPIRASLSHAIALSAAGGVSFHRLAIDSEIRLNVTVDTAAFQADATSVAGSGWSSQSQSASIAIAVMHSNATLNLFASVSALDTITNSSAVSRCRDNDLVSLSQAIASACGIALGSTVGGAIRFDCMVFGSNMSSFASAGGNNAITHVIFHGRAASSAGGIAMLLVVRDGLFSLDIPTRMVTAVDSALQSRASSYGGVIASRSASSAAAVSAPKDAVSFVNPSAMLAIRTNVSANSIASSNAVAAPQAAALSFNSSTSDEGLTVASTEWSVCAVATGLSPTESTQCAGQIMSSGMGCCSGRSRDETAPEPARPLLQSPRLLLFENIPRMLQSQSLTQAASGSISQTASAPRTSSLDENSTTAGLSETQSARESTSHSETTLSHTVTFTGSPSLVLPPPLAVLPPAPAPLPAVTQAMQGPAATSAVVGALVAPSIASQPARLAAGMKMSQCRFQPSPPDTMSYPFRMVYGTGQFRDLDGAVLLNGVLALLVALAVVLIKPLTTPRM